MAKVLKWSECAWWLVDSSGAKSMLGNERDITAVRIDKEVLVESTTIPAKMYILHADTTIKGFGPSFDGQTLEERMEEDTIYNCTLRLESERDVW